MRILFVFTGGTIGSTDKGGFVGVDAEKSHRLLTYYKQKYSMDVECDVLEPYRELSENNTGETLSALLRTVTEGLYGYDGVVVTHGTDTLQYTAAALGLVLGNNSVPVCLVSANYPVENARSNALVNLHGAVSFIAQRAGRGVFVVYRNEGNAAPTVFRATRLLESMAFSDTVTAAFDTPYGSFSPDFTFLKNPAFTESADALPAPRCTELGAECRSVLRLFCHVGMSYPTLGEDVRFVLLNAYHSGTVNVKAPAALAFYKEARERGIPVLVAGVPADMHYESLAAWQALGLVPLPQITPITAYMKLWLYAPEAEDAPTLLATPRGGDVIL